MNSQELEPQTRPEQPQKYNTSMILVQPRTLALAITALIYLNRTTTAFTNIVNHQRSGQQHQVGRAPSNTALAYGTAAAATSSATTIASRCPFSGMLSRVPQCLKKSNKEMEMPLDSPLLHSIARGISIMAVRTRRTTFFQKSKKQPRKKGGPPSHSHELVKHLYVKVMQKSNKKIDRGLTDVEMRQIVSRWGGEQFTYQMIIAFLQPVNQREDSIMPFLDLFLEIQGLHRVDFYRWYRHSPATTLKQLSFLRRWTMSFERTYDQALKGAYLREGSEVGLAKYHADMKISKDIYGMSIEVVHRSLSTLDLDGGMLREATAMMNTTRSLDGVSHMSWDEKY